MKGLQEQDAAQPPAPAGGPEDQAVAEVYALHREKLRMYLHASGFDPTEVEDAIQDSIKAVRDAVLRGGEIANLKPYWYRAAVLRAMRLSRERAARMRRSVPRPDPGTSEDPLLVVPDPANRFGAELSRLEMLSLVRQLPRRRRRGRRSARRPPACRR